MGKAERDRYGQKQRPYAERHLQHREQRQRECASQNRRRGALQRKPQELAERRGDDRVTQHAVVELDGQRILKQVQIPGRGLPEAGRHEGAIDERPGVVAHAGIEARNQRPRQHLHEDEGQHGARHPHGTSPAQGRGCSPGHAKAEQEPERRAENDKSKAEMRGEPILAHIGAKVEAALHHVPAERALKTAKNEQADETRQKRRRDVARRPEHDKGHQEGNTDQPPKEPMRPFPPINGLEFFEAHAALELAIFRNGLVGREGLLPVRLR